MLVTHTASLTEFAHLLDELIMMTDDLSNFLSATIPLDPL